MTEMTLEQFLNDFPIKNYNSVQEYYDVVTKKIDTTEFELEYLDEEIEDVELHLVPECLYEIIYNRKNNSIDDILFYWKLHF
jgi:hypothetical protein